MTKEVTLKIEINRSVAEVFDFTLNPANTPKWIDGIQHEETNEWPVRLGTVYRNKNTNGEWAEYKLSEFEPNKAFTLARQDRDYHVRYTFTSTGNRSCILNYHEWVEHGELTGVFTQDALDKLKQIIESE